MTRMPFPTGVPPLSAELRIPDTIPEPGLLVGWSLEATHRRTPVGFSFGPPKDGTSMGFVDPVLMKGEGHLLTIAPTGAGKGVGCIIPALLRHDGPIIVIDPKGENTMVTARHRRDIGQEVVILDPMGLTGEKPGRFNPLSLIDPGDARGVDEAATIVNALLPLNLAGERNLYWLNRARTLMLACVLHVATDMEPDDRTLAKVREVVNDLAANPDKGARAMAKSRHPEVRMIADNLRIAAKETLGSIISFAQEGIDFLRGPQIQDASSATTFDINAVTRGDPVSIYIVLPPHMLASHGRFLRLWIGSLLTLIMRRQAKPPASTLFILDEAAQLGTLDELRTAVTLLRGYGLQTWSFWQDVSQLKALYPNDWQTMVNNCRVFQAFGANNLAAATDMAEIVGFLSGQSLLDLEQGEMLLQIAGDEAVIAQLPHYLTDPAFAGKFDDNPLFDSARDPMPEARPLPSYLRARRELVRPARGAAGRTGPRPLEQNAIDELIAERLLDAARNSR
ncbi:MAG: type IV secretory system conjugative DNA transfer family protein [Pseudomonadota bacterium]